MNETCRTCRFFRSHWPDQRQDLWSLGDCLRFPPMIHHLGAADRQPYVNALHDWCGEHQERTA